MVRSDRKNTCKVVRCEDFGRMADIWLEASVAAHGFIPREYWEANAEPMRTRYLPSAENYAYVEDGRAVGFISLNGEHIEALFVSPSCQGRGIGSALLGYAKNLCRTLTLAVYKENSGAMRFYMDRGFSVVEERVDVQTNHPEIIMKWSCPF